MLEFIQNWLFPKVPLAPQVYDDEGYQVYFGGARRHKTIRMDDGEYAFRCQYSPTDPFTGAGRESAAYPPLHFHRNQSEEVRVIQGRVGYVLEKRVGFASKGDVLQLPKGKRHTFWCDPTSEDDLIMEFSIRPGQGLDERWIDNFYGILESHYRVNKPVSFLQVMVFCDEGASAPGNLPKPIAILMAYVFGRVIGRLAGYKGSYPVYEPRPLK